MRTPIRIKRLSFPRLVMVLVFLLSGLLAAGGLTAGLAAQDRAKPPQKEEEEEPAPKPRPKTPLRVGDEDTEGKPASRAAGAQVTNLEREAQRAKNPAVQELYRSLARPHDVVTMRSGTQTWN